MQLTKVHLFLILIFALILASSLGNYVRDGFTTTKPTELPQALRPVATKNLPGNTNNDQNMNAGVSPTQVGSPVSSFSPSTFPLNSPAGIPGVNSVTGNDQAGKEMDCKPKEKCPPCPACARCPKPAFECKKVPIYSSSDDNNIPRPVMANFSQFGM
jgi:hypothetical protein